MGPLCTVEDVDPAVVRGGRAPSIYWLSPLSGSVPAHGIGLVGLCPAFRSAPLLSLCVCTGVGCPASGLLLQLVLLRPPRESGGRGERVWICLDGNCCASTSRWRSSRLPHPPERAITAITHSPSGRPTHPGLRACRVGPAHTRGLGQPGAERRGGKGALGRLDVSLAQGPWAARRWLQRNRGQSRLLVAVASSVHSLKWGI